MGHGGQRIAQPNYHGPRPNETGTAVRRGDSCAASRRPPQAEAGENGDRRRKVCPARDAGIGAMVADVRRAMAITARLNRLTFNDADEVRAVFSELIGQKVDDSFLWPRRFSRPAGRRSASGATSSSTRTARSTISAGSISATTYDRAERQPDCVRPSGCPRAASRGRRGKPIVIERNVWIAAGAIVIGGVTIGENSVVAAGSVVTRTCRRTRWSEEIRRGSSAQSAHDEAPATD